MSTAEVSVPELSFVMPAYNEEGALPSTLADCERAMATLSMPAEVVIANDGSTDGTGAVLAGLQRDRPWLRVVDRPQNGGYGAALSSAIAAARGQLIVTMDSDGQFDPGDAGKLLEKRREGYDVVLGFRARKVDSAVRVFLDRCLRVLVKLLFGVRYRDTNCALRLVPASSLRGLSLEARGFATPTEMAIKLHVLGARVGEVAVAHRERAAGASALRSFRTSIDMMAFLLYLRLKVALFRRRVIQAL